MKERVIGILQVLCFWSGIDGLFYVLNRKRKRILTFHHVIPDAYSDYLRGGVATLERDFRAVIARLRKRWAFSLDLDDPRTITLTFDDGYRSQFDVAAAILYELGNIPAYLFVSGEIAPEGETGNARVRPLLIDALTVWVAYVPDGEYTFVYAGKQVRLSLHGKQSRFEAWVKQVWPLYLEDASSKGREVLARLDACYPFDKVAEALPVGFRAIRLHGMSREMLEELKSRGWAIGAHGVAHYPFGYLSEQAAQKELDACGEALAGIVNTKVFSWPYGGAETIGVVRGGGNGNVWLHVCRGQCQ